MGHFYPLPIKEMRDFCEIFFIQSNKGWRNLMYMNCFKIHLMDKEILCSFFCAKSRQKKKKNSCQSGKKKVSSNLSPENCNISGHEKQVFSAHFLSICCSRTGHPDMNPMYILEIFNGISWIQILSIGQISSFFFFVFSEQAGIKRPNNCRPHLVIKRLLKKKKWIKCLFDNSYLHE